MGAQLGEPLREAKRESVGQLAPQGEEANASPAPEGLGEAPAEPPTEPYGEEGDGAVQPARPEAARR